MSTTQGGRVGSTEPPLDGGANWTAASNPFGDEYKILQDKIDKVGASRLTIKGWSVTAMIGVFLAIATNKGFSPSVSALGLDVLLAFFFWFEREQVRYSWEFIARARSIEIQTDKFRRAAGERVLFSSPNIVRSHFRDKKRRDTDHFEFKNRALEKARIRASEQFRLAIGSDVVFYLVLGIAAWLPIYVRSTAQSPSVPIVIQNTIQMPKQEATPVSAANPNGPSPPSQPKARNGGSK
jgi:hypothetical protein